MQKYKCKHFRRVFPGICCQLGNCCSCSSCATLLLHKSTKVCATNVPLHWSNYLSVCLSIRLSVDLYALQLFYWVTHTHTHTCQRAGGACVCVWLLSVNHLKIVFSFQLFIYCGTCSHSICHAAIAATATATTTTTAKASAENKFCRISPIFCVFV